MHVKKGELLAKAISIANEAHRCVLDRGGSPYILHPIRVMMNLNSSDEELNCIAVLHDAIEDCKSLTYSHLIEEGMTDRIIAGVKCVTKVPGQSEAEYKEVVFSNVDAMLVKRADLIDNSDIRRLKGIRDKDIERTVKYQKFFLEIEQRLAALNAAS